MTDDDATPSAAELREIAESLFRMWDTDRAGTLKLGPRDGKPDQGHLLSIYGLAAHTIRVAEAALVLIEKGLHLQAVPLVRAGWETAITAQWVAQAKDGAEALLNESMRQRAATAVDYAATSTEAIRLAGIRLIEQDDYEKHETSSAEQGKHFRMRCLDFKDGIDLYAYYRLMSAFTHPGVYVIDEYLIPTEDFKGVSTLRTEPMFNREREEPSARPVWLFLVVWEMILAARAVDFIDVEHVRRDRLRALARRLETTSELHLTPGAGARIRKAAREAKRARQA